MRFVRNDMAKAIFLPSSTILTRLPEICRGVTAIKCLSYGIFEQWRSLAAVNVGMAAAHRRRCILLTLAALIIFIVSRSSLPSARSRRCMSASHHGAAAHRAGLQHANGAHVRLRHFMA